MDVQFQLLGPLRVTVAGAATPIAGKQQRALLATLLLNTGWLVSAKDLIAELWPDRTETVRINTVHAQVARLRSTLPVPLTGRSGGYLLDAPADAVDVHQFTALHGRAAVVAASQPEWAARMLRDALGLWDGDALQDATIGRRCAAAAASLNEQRMQAHERLARLHITLGQPETAVGDLVPLAHLHPMRETLLAELMSALEACGRRAEALLVFQQARERFTAELGCEPGPVMCRQHLRILQGGA